MEEIIKIEGNEGYRERFPESKLPGIDPGAYDREACK